MYKLSILLFALFCVVCGTQNTNVNPNGRATIDTRGNTNAGLRCIGSITAGGTAFTGHYAARYPR